MEALEAEPAAEVLDGEAGVEIGGVCWAYCRAAVCGGCEVCNMVDETGPTKEVVLSRTSQGKQELHDVLGQMDFWDRQGVTLYSVRCIV